MNTRHLKAWLILLATTMVWACSSDSSSSRQGNQGEVPDLGIIEVIHASGDAPFVDVLVGEAVTASALDYVSAPGTATDLLDNIVPAVLIDDTGRIASEAEVRVFHGSASTGEVDIYVVSPGADISTTTPAFTAVPFGADTGYVPFAAGDYELIVTATGTIDVAIGPVTVSVNAGGIYTAVARDEVGGGTPPGLILYDERSL